MRKTSPLPNKRIRTPYSLELALKADSFRAKHNRRSAKAFFEQIKAEGYDGDYIQLTAFIRSWRGEHGKSLRTFVPLTFECLSVQLERRRPADRRSVPTDPGCEFWLVAYPSQGIMKTSVDKVNKGKGRTVNARFAVMCAHYLFDPDFCNVASGWEKGIIEKNVRNSRRRIWLDAQNCMPHTLEELNTWLGQRCRAGVHLYRAECRVHRRA